MFGCPRLGSSDAFGPVFLNFSVWELCFSLVFPLWELCYCVLRGGGGTFFVPHSLFSFLSPSLSSIPLFPSSIPLLFSFSTAFSSVSSSFSLLCPHLFLLFSSFLPSFHYVFLLCLPSFSSFSSFEINHFLFQRTNHFLF